MKPHILFFFLTVLFNLTHSPSLQAIETTQPCFDFNQKELKTLIELPSNLNFEKDIESTGHSEFDWATKGGIVEKPILGLYQKLLDPSTIRNDPKTKIELKEIENKNFIKTQNIHIHSRPVFFLTLDWNEQWGFQLKEGTETNPEAILISYQKTEGTSYIKTLCGNIFLKALTDSKSKQPKTSVFFYERVNATRRNEKDILNNISGTLKTLREANSPK